MRRILLLILILALLTGCKSEESILSRGIQFRSELLSAGGCSFRGEITADYGEEVSSFTLDCVADHEGNVTFCVVSPETISGITGVIDGNEGKVTYDGLQLAFPLLVYDRISPVAAPGIIVECWLKEFILSAGISQYIYRATYEKKIHGNALLIDTYFEKDIPISVELCYNGNRIIEMKITDFSY